MPRLVREFKHIFLVFKQYYTYFHTFFHPTHISKKTKKCCLNKRTKRVTIQTNINNIITIYHFCV